MPEPGFVIFNGLRVAADWPEQVEESQTVMTIGIGGREYPRVRYGDEKEDWGADGHPCHDCAVIKGQFHVIGCDGERCPCCGGQAMSCDCPYDTDKQEPE
jgi:hypothetical protein